MNALACPFKAGSIPVRREETTHTLTHARTHTSTHIHTHLRHDKSCGMIFQPSQELDATRCRKHEARGSLVTRKSGTATNAGNRPHAGDHYATLVITNVHLPLPFHYLGQYLVSNISS